MNVLLQPDCRVRPDGARGWERGCWDWKKQPPPPCRIGCGRAEEGTARRPGSLAQGIPSGPCEATGFTFKPQDPFKECCLRDLLVVT